MDALSKIALTFTPGLGNTTIRRLVDLCKGEDVFSLPPSELRLLFANHGAVYDNVVGKVGFARAEQELRFCEQHGIQPLFFTDADYPRRLNRGETQDCPALLYRLGGADLNVQRSVAMVGTRRATPQGRTTADRLVEQMKPLGCTVVSGLAYGIDTAAHAAALAHGLPTVAVLGHGLDRIYPTPNTALAKQIIAMGGALLTEYPSGTAINPRYFPARNRIIAALADATVVVEASERGGALITAAIAAGYHREVFAVPGRITDTYSSGTNNLIATQRALLLRHADDLAYQLGWPLPSGSAAGTQQHLLPTLDAAEQPLFDLLDRQGRMSIDELAEASGMPMPRVAGLLFGLEMKKVVRVLPGHLYERVEG